MALAREFGLFIIADEIYIHMVFPGCRDRASVRGRPRRAGHRHARHLQGTALAGLALRLDRGAQPGAPTRTSPPTSTTVRRGQAAGGLLHERAAADRAPHLRRSPLRRATGRRARPCSPRGPRRPTTPSASSRACKINRAQGAFYMTAVFEPGVLDGNNRLPIDNPELSDIVERQCVSAALDARFVYHLLASTGHLRGAAERLLLAAPGVPLHPAGDRRREAALDVQDAGRGGHRVLGERPGVGGGAAQASSWTALNKGCRIALIKEA